MSKVLLSCGLPSLQASTDTYMQQNPCWIPAVDNSQYTLFIASGSYKLTKNRHHVAMKRDTGNGLPSHKPCIEPASADAEMAPASQPTAASI